MKLDIKRSERYIVSKELINGWKRFGSQEFHASYEGEDQAEEMPMDEGRAVRNEIADVMITPLRNQRLEEKEKNGSQFLLVEAVDRISIHFTSITMTRIPTVTNIRQNNFKIKFIVYDDSVVELPINYLNYIPYSQIRKYIARITPAVETKLNHIWDMCKQLAEKKAEFNHQIMEIRNRWNAELNLATQEINSEIAEYHEILDDTIFNHQEKLSYTSEIKTYIKD